MTRSQQMVITLTATDRPGVIDQLAQVISQHDGNWLDASLARLAGHFAGVVLVSIPGSQEASLCDGLRALEAHGIEAQCTGATPTPEAAGKLYQLELVGSDRPGIVGQLSESLAEHSVNVERLDTRRESGSMSGAPLFRATAQLRLPADLDEEHLIGELEALAADLQVSVQAE